MTDVTQAIQRLQRFVRAIAKDDSIGSLLRAIGQTRAEAFAFGGMPRDVLFSGPSFFGDVDIFVSGTLDEAVLERATKVVGRTNFGGLRIVAGRYDVDIWELARSRAFLERKSLPISVPSLLSTVCFSTDAVSISFSSRRIVASKAFWKSLENRQIDFVSRPRDLDVLQATRAIRAIAKHSLTPSRAVAEYVDEVLAVYGTVGILTAEERWRDKRYLDKLLLELAQRKVAGVLRNDSRKELLSDV
jgi:hypothetical protein